MPYIHIYIQLILYFDHNKERTVIIMIFLHLISILKNFTSGPILILYLFSDSTFNLVHVLFKVFF